MSILFSIILILHGLVHLLYAGQSRRLFELRPGLHWPSGSWLFSRFMGDSASRSLAIVLLVLAALGFAASGIGLLIQQEWWRPAAVGAAILSAAIFLVFWDGKLKALDAQGWIGVLIDLAVVVLVWLLNWPVT